MSNKQDAKAATQTKITNCENKIENYYFNNINISTNQSESSIPLNLSQVKKTITNTIEAISSNSNANNAINTINTNNANNIITNKINNGNLFLK